MSTIIDCDQHLFEPRGLWSDYADPARRDLAIEMQDDDHGHTHVIWKGRRIAVAHEALLKLTKSGSILTVVMASRGYPVGAITLERETEAPFEEDLLDAGDVIGEKHENGGTRLTVRLPRDAAERYAAFAIPD